MDVKTCAALACAGGLVAASPAFTQEPLQVVKFVHAASILPEYAPQFPFSLAGIRSGMPVKEAIQASTEYGYGLDVTSAPYLVTERSLTLDLGLGKEAYQDRLGSQFHDELLVRFTSPTTGERVASVSLTKRFTKDSAPVLSAEVQRLTELYGPPNEVAQYGARWFLDSGGRPLERDAGECFVFEYLTFFLALEAENTPDYGYEIQCSAHFSLYRWADADGDIYFRQEFADHTLIRTDSMAVSDAVRDYLDTIAAGP